MNELALFLKNKKVALMFDYDRALESNNYFHAKSIRAKVEFIEELLRENESHV